MATPADLRRRNKEARARREAAEKAKAAQEGVMAEAYRRRAEATVQEALLNAEHAADREETQVHVMDVYAEGSGMGMEKEGFSIPRGVLQQERMAMAEPYFWLTRVAWYVYVELVAMGYGVKFTYRGTHREYFKMFMTWGDPDA